MSFPAYPAYRDSGVAWLGPLPRGWAVKRVKHVTRSFEQGWSPQCDGFPVASEDEWGVLKVGCVNGGRFNPEENKALPAELAPLPELGIAAGDVLISRANTRELVGGAVCVSADHPNLLLCDKLYRLRLNDAVCVPQWLAIYLRSDAARGQIELAANGASQSMVNIGQGTILDLPMPLPMRDEQFKILAFLDRETGKIDALVAEQERLIALLKEKRQAVISQAVTKGLDASAPMKDSGVVWLGQVPAHWEVRKLRNIARLETGHTPSRKHPEYWIESECVIPWFTLADVGSLRDERTTVISTTSEKISRVGMENSAARLLPQGAVILSRTASVGFSGIMGLPMAVSQDFAAWICGASIRPNYLLMCLRAMKGEFRRMMMGSTHQTIYMPDIEAFRVPVPPTEVQTEIVAFVASRLAAIDTLTTETHRAIALLRERRAALISAAVTGKIDVRSAVVAAATKPDRARFRVIVGAEIIHQHEGNPKFGRVKLQKALYLAETHAGIHELQGNYLRQAAGPFDRALIEETEAALRAGSVYDAEQRTGSGGAVAYRRLAKSGQHVTELKALLGPRTERLRSLIALLRDLDLRQVEAVATLYAVWNDLLKDGQQPSDEEIFNGVLTDWHAKKSDKFTRSDLSPWLDWMRRNDLVPHGEGPRVSHTMPRDLFQ